MTEIAWGVIGILGGCLLVVLLHIVIDWWVDRDR